jgi:hypothetical protein
MSCHHPGSFNINGTLRITFLGKLELCKPIISLSDEFNLRDKLYSKKKKLPKMSWDESGQIQYSP